MLLLASLAHPGFFSCLPQSCLRPEERYRSVPIAGPGAQKSGRSPPVALLLLWCLFLGLFLSHDVLLLGWVEGDQGRMTPEVLLGTGRKGPAWPLLWNSARRVRVDKRGRAKPAGEQCRGMTRNGLPVSGLRNRYKIAFYLVSLTTHPRSTVCSSAPARDRFTISCRGLLLPRM